MANGADAASYAAANARVRGLQSRLLTDTDWADLLGSTDLRSTLALLQDTQYGDIVAEVESTGDLDLERIERHLWGQAAENVRKAVTLTTGRSHTLLLVWWQHFELENLKALFRGFHQGMEPDTIRRFLIPLGDYPTLPWETLLHERTVISLIDRLRNTHYTNPLRNALPIYQRERSLFSIEVALDIRYYRDIARAINDLTGSAREEARRIVGTWLDILNILWAFRYRVYYNLSAEEIVNYTLWRTVRTDATLVREIALGADPREVAVRVWGPDAVNLTALQGFDIRNRLDQGQILAQLELILERFWQHLAQSEMTGYPFKLGTLLGYVVLQELEVRDLVTLLEGKSMGWSPEHISQRLIRSKE